MFKKKLFAIPIFLLFVSCGNMESDTAKNAIAKAVPDAVSQTVGVQASKDYIRKAYSAAIAAYIDEVYKDGVPRPDTLFIGKHPDFPDIKLPAVIENTNIMLLTNEDAKKKMEYRESMVYLNVMGWVEDVKSEFLIVTFLDAAKPQHNCTVSFKFDSSTHELQKDSLYFEYPYGRQLRSH